jgi:hypothetical protein
VPGWRVRKLLRQAVKEFFGQAKVLKIQRQNKRQVLHGRGITRRNLSRVGEEEEEEEEELIN